MTTRRKGPATKRARSGTQWSETQIAERWDAVKLRLKPGYKSRLAALANADGRTLSGQVEAWIDAAGPDGGRVRR